MKTYALHIIFTLTILICLCGFSAEDVNLAPNAGFEKSGLKSQTPEAYINCNTYTKNPCSGNNCIIQNYKKGYSWNTVQSSFVKVEADKYYSLKVWNRNTVPSGDIAFGVRFVNKKSKSISYCWKSVTLNTQDSWTEYKLKFKTPPDTAFLSIYFRIGGDVSTGDVFWDDISLTEASADVEHLILQPLKSVVFFKQGNEFTSNYIFIKDSGKFENIQPSDISLNLTVNKANGASNNLVYELRKKYSTEVISSKQYDITLPQQKVTINPQIDKLAIGRYVITLKLQNSAGANAETIAVIGKEISIMKYHDFPVLEPAEKVSITGTTLQVNGKPFIPICFYHPSLTSNYFSKIKQFGENVKQVWSDVPGGIQANIDNFKKVLDLCLANNSYAFIVMHTSWALDHKNKRYNLDNIAKLVNALKKHPAVFMWSITDEPDAMKIPPEDVEKAYRLIKKLDTEHPVWVNLCLPDKFKAYAPYSDVASYDHYPNPYQPMMTVYKWNNLISQASSTVKPLLCVLQTYSRPGTALPDYKWLRTQTYICVIQGMKMFFFYSFNDPAPAGSLSCAPELQSQVKLLTSEIVSIADVITADSVPCLIDGLNAKGILYSLRKVDNSKYLIVVNPYEKGMDCKFILPERSNNTSVEVLFEDNRAVDINSDGLIEEKMAPLAVHIYRYR